jgi:3-oxoacyl-[acyl-carrier-protein] synthase-1
MNVPIVAIGARTPLGYRAAPSAAAVRCEIRRIEEHSLLVDRRGQPIRMAMDDGLDAMRLGTVRLLVLARSALREAL